MCLLCSINRTTSNTFLLSFSLTTGIFILICTEMPYQPFHCYIAWSYNNVPCPGNPGESVAGIIHSLTHMHARKFTQACSHRHVNTHIFTMLSSAVHGHPSDTDDDIVIWWNRATE